MPKKIAVIDGNSLMHRAYHAVPATMNAPDGTPTNAAFGFLSMFLKFYEMARPDAVVCAFDAGRPAFRMEALEQYKAQRPPMDAELKAQFPVIEHLLESMNVPVIRVKGWEGDDVLGTVSARDEELGYETLLVSGDKDVYQLVTDCTHVVTTKKGITDVAIYGPAEVEERYGVTPAQFPDFLGLKGDSSDNIPGVPGIGDKTAAKLLQNYGSIDGIYDNLDKLKGKQLQNLTEHKEDAYTSRRVATIVRDVEFDLDLEGVKFPDFDSAKVAEAFGEVRFNAHLAKVLALAGADESLAAPAALELPSLAPVVGDYAHDALKTAMEHDVCLGVEFLVEAQESLFAEPHRLFVGLPDSVLMFEGEDAHETFAEIVRSGHFCALDCEARAAGNLSSRFRGRSAHRCIRDACGALLRYWLGRIPAEFQCHEIRIQLVVRRVFGCGFTRVRRRARSGCDACPRRAPFGRCAARGAWARRLARGIRAHRFAARLDARANGTRGRAHRRRQARLYGAGNHDRARGAARRDLRACG